MMNNIPKVIHYCWFGKNNKSKLIQNCIASWKKYLPDYEIIEWNETNFDVNSNDFVKDAYENKKWAFVSDYCRLWVLCHYGGVYLDTDMEVLKSLNIFLNEVAFGGIEKLRDKEHINMAIWGCKKNDEFIKHLLNKYENINFTDYRDNLFKLAIPNIVTEKAVHLGWDKNRQENVFFNGTKIYSREYFYPKGFSWEECEITDHTYTIHHYDGSWKKPHQIIRTKTKMILIKILGYKIVDSITKIIKKK